MAKPMARGLVPTIMRKRASSRDTGFFYDYDGANNRLKLRREFGTGTKWDSAYFAYAADNSLTQRRKQTPPSTFLSTYYSYDANGALIKEWTPGGGGGWGNQAWGSSPYGGGTGDDVVYYEYGPQQLVTRIIPTSEAPTQFFYDGRLNRYLINQAGTPTYYLWDGLNQLEERNADGALKARYTHGNYRQYGIGSVVEVERVANSTTYFQYLHMDHRGTAYAVTDASQSTQLSYVQDAFGTQLAATGGANPNVPNNLIYQSNWLTLQVGGRNYGVSRYRLYDPDLGTFLSRDFLPFLNKYRAWSNNPTGQVDRDGLADAEAVPVTAPPVPKPGHSFGRPPWQKDSRPGSGGGIGTDFPDPTAPPSIEPVTPNDEPALAAPGSNLPRISFFGEREREEQLEAYRQQLKARMLKEIREKGYIDSFDLLTDPIAREVQSDQDIQVAKRDWQPKPKPNPVTPAGISGGVASGLASGGLGSGASDDDKCYKCCVYDVTRTLVHPRYGHRDVLSPPWGRRVTKMLNESCDSINSFAVSAYYARTPHGKAALGEAFVKFDHSFVREVPQKRCKPYDGYFIRNKKPGSK